MAPPRVTTVFSKRPVPGDVKTRLCPPLTREQASDLALAMLDDTLAKCLRSHAFETCMCVAPETEIEWFRARYPAGPRVRVQHGAGLGLRLAHHFDEELRLGASTLVCLGGDAPHVPIERAIEAHEALERGADVVLGPDVGGGYYLVGLKRPLPILFTEITMSTATMCAETIALARSMKLDVVLLENDYDIDEPADLERLRRELASGLLPRARLPSTAALLERLFQA